MRVAPLKHVASGPMAIQGLALRDFISLTKPRLSGLVLFTAIGAMWLASRPLTWATWLFAVLGIAGTIGAANTLNCFIERDSDRFMARTAQRPLPAGRMEPATALGFGVVLAVLSLAVLAVEVNLLTAALGLVALLSYVLAYTPMKSRTHWAMLVGAVPGALPPLMGWTAATNAIEWPGVVLFGVLFFWQLPHFIAIALFRKSEYRAAKLLSLPLEKGDDTARLHAVIYMAALLVVSVLPYVVRVAGVGYLVVALGLGAAFAGLAVRGWLQRGDEVWARRFFGMSLVYLVGLFVALGLDGGRHF